MSPCTYKMLIYALFFFFYAKQAMENNKLFILDHHDALMTYLTRINTTTTKTYATRTVLLLQDDCTLKPLAIELSLPHAEGEQLGAISQVFTPAEQGIEGSMWQLAKAYAAVNDSGYHQLISHWCAYCQIIYTQKLTPLRDKILTRYPFFFGQVEYSCSDRAVYYCSQ